MRTALMSTTVAVFGALAAVCASPAQAHGVNFAVSINAPVGHGVVVGATAFSPVPVVVQPVVVVGQPVVFVPAPVVVIRSGHYGHHHHHDRYRNDFRGYRGNGYRY